MSSTPDPDPDAHAHTQELLPWLLNGTLEGAELERVKAHLDSCEACQAQLAWERSLRAAAQQQSEPALSTQQALADLLPRLGPQQRRTGLLGRWITGAAANEAHWLPTVAAVELGVILLLGLLLIQPREDSARYHTLGARPAAQQNVVVTFDPATPERELRRILQASGGRLVDGPTVTDAYVLAIAPAEAGRVLERLRAEPAVTFAQPLSTGSGR